MDAGDLSRVFFAFVTVLGFIGAAALIVRKSGIASGAMALAKTRRLQIIETLPLDARRRIAIIRCDGREHLLVLGQSSETVIDADIPAMAVLTENATEPAPFAMAQTFSFLKKSVFTRDAEKPHAA